jgi:hypothetical protein
MAIFGDVVMAGAVLAIAAFTVMYIGAVHISLRFNKDHNVKDLDEAG